MILNRHFFGQKPDVFYFDHRIAFATAPLEAFSVEHGDVPADIPNEPGAVLARTLEYFHKVDKDLGERIAAGMKG